MPTLSDDTRARLTLHLIPGLGPLRSAALLEHFGSAEAVLRAGAAELAGVPRIGAGLAADVVAGRAGAGVEEELRLMEQHRVGVVVLGTPGYPPPLAEIDTPPQLLYVRGALEERDARAVAVVGSRSCTDYGRR